MRIREIEDTDIFEVSALLTEGFPRRTLGYWQTALNVLSRRQNEKDYPRYGYGLDVDGRLEGVLLVWAARIDGSIRSNLSSWYVRSPYRSFAPFLHHHAARAKGSVYLNLSPAPHTIPMLEAFGFRPYTGGTLLVDARSVIKLADSIVRPLTAETASRLDIATRSTVEAHIGYGCTGLLLEDAEGPMVALYRIKWLKGLVPAARFVAGDPARLIKAAGGLMRFVLRRGMPLLVIDAPMEWVPPSGIRLLANRERRYVKGVVAPAPGDLRETDIALFGL
jgi:hypothetical protein